MRPTFEPGVLRVVQILTLAQVIGIPLLRRTVGAGQGIDVPLGQFLVVTMPIPLLLLALTWLPSLRERLGGELLPAVLVLASVNVVLEKYLTLTWLVAPALRELNGLLLLVRLWLLLHAITLLVAWQYSLRWTLLAALSLSLADGLLSWPFIPTSSPLHPLFLLLFIARTTSVTVVALGVGWLVQQQREQQQALAAANLKLTHYAFTAERLAVSQERNRLARELHDTLAHSLSALIVQLEAVEAICETNPQTAYGMVERALSLARTGLTEARRSLQALRANPLEEVGLAVAVSNLARATAARANLALDLHVPGDGGGLALEQEDCVYRVAQEALTNVERHAQATAVRVILAQDNGRLILTIADNGQGFAVSEARNGHFGLQGMRERAAVIGGALEVDSRPEGGTMVRLVLDRQEGRR
ncbi:MAG: sensor histidine kinase [Anaerolineae bacterium]|nr:sensor histidine kinase [Anaerolineae bacterium]